MRSLYLLEPYGMAGLEGEQVVIRRGGDLLERVRLPLLDQILVMGNVQLSTPLLRACLQRNVAVAYLSRSGWCHGRLIPVERGYRHRSRYQLDLGDGERLTAARQLVAGKVANGRVLLQRLTRRERRSLVDDTLKRLQWHQDQIKHASSAERIRGLEGNAASDYFHALGALLETDGFPFLGRHRRPPTTGFDALCGFGYSVLWNAVYSLCDLHGLDPYEGVLHAGSSRHAALVSDLIEPLRTLLVDPFNVWLIRTRQLKAQSEHLEARDGGVFLSDVGRRIWLQRWGTYMAEVVTISEGVRGPRWDLLDRLVRSFVRFLYQPSEGLVIPGRR
jgi:CRISPR-associated protein Cas1